MTALDTQIGGDHYKNFPIQPVEFITKNKLGFLEGCIVKRLCRKRFMDLKKIKHEVDLLIELDILADKKNKNYQLPSDQEQSSNIEIIKAFSADLLNLINTQNNWKLEDLNTIIKALIKNKY